MSGSEVTLHKFVIMAPGGDSTSHLIHFSSGEEVQITRSTGGEESGVTGDWEDSAEKKQTSGLVGNALRSPQLLN
jgi:hypothetical protein